jgi:hypothetical protein
MKLQRADELLARAALDGRADDPVAIQLQQEAQQLEARADAQFMRQILLSLGAVREEVVGRIQPFEESFNRITEQERQSTAQVQAEQAAFSRLQTDMISARIGETGAAEFGPEGFGFFEVDSAGNITDQTTPLGEKVLPELEAIVREMGLPINMQSFNYAIDILNSRMANSEGGTGAGASNPAGGGDYTLPAGGMDHGASGARPSPRRQTAADNGMW